jgi:tetratricopeptide (TPR) repeat protein
VVAPLGYADHLYAEREYFRAAGEYHRYLYEQPAGPLAGAAHARLGWCYVHGARWEQALRQFRQLSGVSLGLGRAYLGLGRLAEARAVFEALHAERQLARLAAREGRWAAALPAYEGTSAADALRARLAYRPLSPELAAACALVPGGGYLYAGQPTDALAAFTVTSGFGLTAWYYAGREPGNPIGLTCGGLAGVFWAGSAFGAVRETVRASAAADARARAAVEAVADAEEPAW